MPKLKFELNYGSGYVEKPSPRNSQKMKIQLVWINQFPNATISGTDFIWDGINAKEMWARKASGISGGYGITEGVGLRISMWCGGNNWQQFYEGCVSLASNKTLWEKDQVTAPSVQTYRIDWFNTQIQSIPFDLLASLPVGAPGRIIPSQDYKQVPYCVVKLSQAPLQKALTALTEGAVIKMGLESAKNISQLTARVSGDAATATATAGLATPTVAATIVEISIESVYLITCAISLIVETKKVIDSIWDFKKYKLAMREQDHWKRICEYLGLQFSSTIYAPGSKHENETWMPRKTIIPDLLNPLTVFTRPYDESINFPNNPNVYGHYDGLASSFVKTMQEKYNGACSIKKNAQGQNTLYFEEKHHFNVQAVFTIPNTIQGNGYAHNAPQPFGTNILDLPWNYLLSFATDDTEESTLYPYRGTTWSKNVSPTIVYNIGNCERGKGVQVNLECATAKRKNYLSEVENLVNDVINFLISVVQAIVNVIAGIINAIAWIINLFGGNVQPVTAPVLPTNLLNNRLGWLQVTDDKWTVPKSFVGMQQGTDWVLHPNSEAWCSANDLGNDFHIKNLPTHGAQMDIYRQKKFKFCCSDFNRILDDNVVTTPAGGLGNLFSLEWELETEEATADYGIYKVETNNFTERTTVDGN